MYVHRWRRGSLLYVQLYKLRGVIVPYTKGMAGCMWSCLVLGEKEQDGKKMDGRSTNEISRPRGEACLPNHQWDNTQGMALCGAQP